MIIALSGKMQSGKNTTASIIQYLIWKNKVETNIDPYYHTGFQQFLNNTKLANELSGWQQKAFATKVKQIASILTGIPIEKFEDQEFKKTKLGEEWIRYGYADGFWMHSDGNPSHKIMENKPCDKETYEIQRRMNWQTAYKEEITVRSLLQRIGTDCMRNNLHPDVWVNALFSEYIETIDMTPNSARTSGINVRSLGCPNWIITDLRFPNELKAVKDRGGITIRVERNKEVPLEECVIPKDSPLLHPSETALDYAPFDLTIYNNGTIDELIVTIENALKELKII